MWLGLKKTYIYFFGCNKADDLVLNPYEYEEYCSEYLKENGYYDVLVTPKSGDQGVDVIAYKDNQKYAVQCKYFTGSVGNKAIQEVYAGKSFYNCDIAVVMTNSTFTHSAETLAEKLDVMLIEKITPKVMEEEYVRKRNPYIFWALMVPLIIAGLEDASPCIIYILSGAILIQLVFGGFIKKILKKIKIDIKNEDIEPFVSKQQEYK